MINLIKRIFTLTNLFKFSFIFCVIAIFLSIISYNHFDSSFIFYQSDNNKINNMLGSIGANFAAFFALMFGNSSLILVFLLFYFCFIVLREVEIKTEVDRICGFIALFIFSSMLFEFYKMSFHGFIGGGFLGKYFLDCAMRVIKSSVSFPDIIIKSDNSSIIKTINGNFRFSKFAQILL